AILYRLGLGYAVEHDRGLVAALAGGKRGGLTSRSWVHRSAERRGPEGRDGRRVGGVEAGAVDGDAHVAVPSLTSLTLDSGYSCRYQYHDYWSRGDRRWRSRRRRPQR